MQALLPSPVGERGDVSPRSGERGVRGRRGIAKDVGNYNARIKQAFLTGRAWGYTAPSPHPAHEYMRRPSPQQERALCGRLHHEAPTERLPIF